jgi:hypothetical protein
MSAYRQKTLLLRVSLAGGPKDLNRSHLSSLLTMLRRHQVRDYEDPTWQGSDLPFCTHLHSTDPTNLACAPCGNLELRAVGKKQGRLWAIWGDRAPPTPLLLSILLDGICTWPVAILPEKD